MLDKDDLTNVPQSLEPRFSSSWLLHLLDHAGRGDRNSSWGI
jgi:hypothetical protein